MPHIAHLHYGYTLRDVCKKYEGNPFWIFFTISSNTRRIKAWDTYTEQKDVITLVIPDFHRVKQFIEPHCDVLLCLRHSSHTFTDTPWDDLYKTSVHHVGGVGKALQQYILQFDPLTTPGLNAPGFDMEVSFDMEVNAETGEIYHSSSATN